MTRPKTSTMLRRGGPFRHAFRYPDGISYPKYRCIYCDLTIDQIFRREGPESAFDAAAALPHCTRVLVFPEGTLNLPRVVVESYGANQAFRSFLRYTTDGLDDPSLPTPDRPRPPDTTF